MAEFLLAIEHRKDMLLKFRIQCILRSNHSQKEEAMS